MKHMLTRRTLSMVALILVSILVTGCGKTAQQSTAPQPSDISVGQCGTQFKPIIQRLTPVHPSSQSINFISGIHLYALNAGDGTLLWCTYATFNNGPRPATLGNVATALFREEPLSRPDGFVGSTINNGIIYACSRNGYTYAFQGSSGKLLWMQNTGLANFSAPTVAGNMVYVGSSTIYALNAQNGSIRWHYPTSNYDTYSPVIVNGVLYAGSYGAHVYALNAATGTLLWQYNTDGPVVTAPVVADGTIFFSSRAATIDTTIYAVRALDGKLLWHKTPGSSPTASNDVTDAFESSLEVSHSMLYAGSGSYLYKLNSHNGAILWRRRVATPFKVLSANGIVYAASGSSSMDAFNADSGKLLWHNALNPMRIGATARPVLIGGEVYIETMDEVKNPPEVFLHAINTRNGVENWHASVT